MAVLSISKHTWSLLLEDTATLIHAQGLKEKLKSGGRD